MASSSLRSCVGQKEQLHSAERLKKKKKKKGDAMGGESISSRRRVSVPG